MLINATIQQQAAKRLLHTRNSEQKRSIAGLLRFDTKQSGVGIDRGLTVPIWLFNSLCVMGV